MRPRLLDLFAGAGGAARGYQLAGFHVTGVDHVDQPNYCGDVFLMMDALEYLRDLLERPYPFPFDAIHASPPCQFRSSATGRNRHGAKREDHLDLITPTRPLLHEAGVPYVIENVTSAADLLVNPVKLCGSSFGLDVQRHRLFECSFPLMAMPCAHHWWSPRFPVYDGHGENGTSRHYLGRVVGAQGHLNYAGERELREKAMGIDWMSDYELTQAIPPAYTEHIGGYLMAAVQRSSLMAATDP